MCLKLGALHNNKVSVNQIFLFLGIDRALASRQLGPKASNNVNELHLSNENWEDFCWNKNHDDDEFASQVWQSPEKDSNLS